MTTLAIIWGVSVLWCVVELCLAPEGYEDPERGFVLGKPADDGRDAAPGAASGPRVLSHSTSNSAGRP